jgi:hypothetical protein
MLCLFYTVQNEEKIAKTPNGAHPTRSPLFEHFQHFKVLQNPGKKYVDVGNYVHYEGANFQCETSSILGSAKKTNQVKFRRFEFHTVHDPTSA